MWRALFFSIGVMLIVLGVECLVVDQYLVSQRTRIPDIVAKLLDGGQNNAGPGSNQFQASNRGSGTSLWSGGNSQNQGFNQAGYNGRSGSSPFGFAGFGSSTNNQASRQNLLNPLGLRVIKTKDWMPWSLLAAGTLVVLYTNSTRNGFAGDR